MNESKAKPTPEELEALKETLLENLEANSERAQEIEEENFWNSLERGPSRIFDKKKAR